MNSNRHYIATLLFNDVNQDTHHISSIQTLCGLMFQRCHCHLRMCAESPGYHFRTILYRSNCVQMINVTSEEMIPDARHCAA